MSDDEEKSELLHDSDEVLLENLIRLRRTHSHLELLYDTIRDVTSTLSVREVLERLLRRVLSHLDAEVGSILLRGADDKMRIEVAQGLPPEVVDETCMEAGQGISGAVAASGESLLVQDIESDARFRRMNHERYYTNSLISAPLLHTGNVLGVINVNNKRSRDAFELWDLQFLEAMAGQASVALANAHRYEELLDRAQRDSLTGLVNHGHMHSILDIEFKRAKRYKRPLALVMLDVDLFKAFNDRAGHPAGDEALCGVARRLESTSRVHDVVARYGGEEFAVLLPETDLEGAGCFAEKMRLGVESGHFGPAGSDRLTVSAGVAVSDEVESAKALVVLADERLYKAKEAGRNRVCSGDLSDDSSD